MYGILGGSLALIMLYVALQPNSANAAQAGGNALAAGARRLLSPNVAGIPQRKTTAAGTKTSAAPASGSSTTVTV